MNDSAASDLILTGAYHALVNGSPSELPPAAPRLVVNDHAHGEKMLAAIEYELRTCTSFAFSVAFVSRSGVTPLKQTLHELETRNVPGRVLTTDYLSFSDPAALEDLARLSNVEVRLYRTGIPDHQGFHTKGYFFDHADGTRTIIVGSSNMTGDALTKNNEWNLELVTLPEGSLAQSTATEFEGLWSLADPLGTVLDVYRQSYEARRRQLRSTTEQVVPFERLSLRPNAMQAEFVANLNALVDAGERRALLISATGTGKTYAAAFAAQSLAPKRLLFLAHREQILRKSMQSFKNVLGPDLTYGLLSGSSHERDARCLFATMQTMAQSDELARHDPRAFDLIVIDEVHRAASASYERILAHFEPQLYLGMTASPDRPDGFDIYALFDHNIAHEIRLRQALEEDLLCPFHYFGIHDVEVDGRPIDELSDFAHLVCDERVDRMLEQARYYGHCGDRVRGLIFCSRNEEARELSTKMNQRGLATVALSGADSQATREQAVARLTAMPGDPLWDERLDYILSVDIFNEGVDIPEINQVILLRPTESPIVFVQQLGRGLRKDPEHDKDYLVVLDFIGNYANNFMIPMALSDDGSYNKDSIRRYVREGNRVIPGASTVHFDEVSRERIFRSIDGSRVRSKMLREQYALVKHKVGHVPSMVDFQKHGGIDPMLFVDQSRSYARFLAQYEPDDAPALSEQEHLALEYVSRYCAPGVRPHELLAIRALTEGQPMTQERMERELGTYGVTPSEASFRSAGHVLDKSFLGNAGDKKRFAAIDLAHVSADGTIVASEQLARMLEHEAFRSMLSDVVAFGLERFGARRHVADKVTVEYDGLVPNSKYTRRDVCQVLNWDHDEASTIYGYKVKHQTCPIFVTYDKAGDISATTRYADHFEDRGTFSWMTRSRRTLASNEVAQIAHADQTGLAVHLFVKKSDDEGDDFYYLGPVRPEDATETAQPDDNGGTVPIVNFKLRLERPVDEDIYDYLTAAGA